MSENKPRIPDDLQRWIETRKRFHLSHAQVQMARELGMNPQRLGSLANHKQEPWKAPLPVFTSSTRPLAPSAIFLLMMEAAISGRQATVAVTSRNA